MKTLIILMCIGGLLLVNASAFADDWTIMLYLNGDNNLENHVMTDINNIEANCPTANVNMLLMVDRETANADYNWTNPRIYEIKRDYNSNSIGSTLRENLPENDFDMGDPQTLADFGTMCVNAYPADHYMLVVYNHGSGWHKGDKEDNKGISWDDTNGGNYIGIANGELEYALGEIKNTIGDNIDIVHFDACLMQMWEVMEAVRPNADFLIASEENGVTGSTDYAGYLTALNNNTSMSPRTLAVEVESECSEKTNSLIELSKIPNLRIAVDGLALALMQAKDEGYGAAIETARNNAFEMGGNASHIDLWDFAFQVCMINNLPQYLTNACNAIDAAMTNNAVIAYHNTATHSDCKGIAIYHPENPNDYNNLYDYSEIVIHSTHWDEYIKNLDLDDALGTSNFESDFGKWSNASGDNFDWTRKSGSTPSGDTGPSSAYNGNYYIFTEASSPNYPSKTAIINGPTINFASKEIEFSYHMYGLDHTGTLYLERFTDGNWITVWSKSGNQGNQWYNTTIDLSSFFGSGSLRFRVVTGSGWKGDIALDEITISKKSGSIDYVDNLESGFGNWSNVGGDNFDWTRKSGTTPSGSTGPSSAHGGSYYMFIESSSPNYPSKSAIVNGPSINFNAQSGEQIDFWYHMYGADYMGTLYLEENTTGSWHTIWSKSNDQGNQWNNAIVNLSGISGTGTLRFRAVTGSGWRSDIALDDIHISSGAAAQFPTYTDNFENTFGNWNNTTGDNFDWTNKSGATPSGSTGPSSAYEGSYYIFTESSSPNYPSKTAIINGPTIDFNSGDGQINFYYHMYGADYMGILYLEENTSGSWHTIWSKSNDQGNLWRNATVNLSGLSGTGTLRFRAVTGSGWRSDIALDKIVIGPSGPASSSDDLEIPISYSLNQNYPNPFNPKTTIKYELPKAGDISIKIYNVGGQLVKTLINGHKEAGSHTLIWDGTDEYNNNAPSGIYIYRLLNNDGAVDTKKMIMVK